MKKNTFRKEERLCSKKDIDILFHKGSSFFLYPFRIVFARRPLTDENKFPIHVLFSVPKRKFPSAVDRNIVKRRMREAYRLHKSDLYIQLNDQDSHLLLAIQYTAKEIENFSTFNHRMKILCAQLMDEYAKVYMGKDH